MMIPTIDWCEGGYKKLSAADSEYFDNKYDNHDYLPVVCFWKIFFKSFEDPIKY